MTNETETPPSDKEIQPDEGHDAARRAAMERLAGLLAAAPAAALLFDPKRAEAFGDGSFQ
ncbi:hypothetical protein [Marinivivus vitaminiproducens]|uniref:hypothetical protein n=1 Tax=Marinivivus vitaminiproducens TaxID=3035935 RepID=UPI00279ECE18|nr:hypothetical protein P4R82_01045 [Geminicoccaceae bacterium SCSIO 64248]